MLAEESVAAGRIPRLGERFFVVDPLDGTKEFLKRNGEFTVNIALVEQGRPTLGVVIAPATGAAFWGGPAGAFAGRIVVDTLVDTHAIRVDLERPVRIVASRSHGHGALAELCRTMEVETRRLGRLVAEILPHRPGRCPALSAFHPDLRMGHGRRAGGAGGGRGAPGMTLSGEPLRYGNPGAQFLNPFFAAAASAELASRTAAEMRRLLA